MPRIANGGAGALPNAFQNLLDAVGWSRVELARRLDLKPSTIDGWCRDRTPDPAVEAWLRKLLAWQERNARPAGWTARPVGRRAAEKISSP